MNCSPPGASIHGILPARILEWVVVSFSRGSSRPRDQIHVSGIGLWVLYHWATRENKTSNLPPQRQGAQGIYRVTNEAWPDGLRYGLPWWLSGKEIHPANARDVGSIPGLGWSPGEGNGNPLQYSCLENPMNRGAWRATSMGSQSVGHELATDHVHMGSLGRLGSLGEGDWKNMHALSFSAGVTEL